MGIFDDPAAIIQVAGHEYRTTEKASEHLRVRADGIDAVPRTALSRGRNRAVLGTASVPVDQHGNELIGGNAVELMTADAPQRELIERVGDDHDLAVVQTDPSSPQETGGAYAIPRTAAAIRAVVEAFVDAGHEVVIRDVTVTILKEGV